MLYAVCLAPIMSAVFFKYAVPLVEAQLCAFLGRPSVLADYYLMIDIFLAILAPYMFSFASSMVMLTEYDENMVNYIAVTPVGKSGYIVSRLVFPAVIACAMSVILLSFFSLTKMTLGSIILLSLLGSLLSIAISLLLVSFSHNRVEGMALSKLSGIVLLGLPVPFFMVSAVQFFFSPLPSFWVAKMMRDGNAFFVFPALITTGLWIAVLYTKFRKKIS